MLGLDQDLIVGYRGVPGNVLQVVNATYSTPATSSSSTYADTGLTATITPTSTSSKILILVHQAGVGKDYLNTNNAVHLRLLRGSTQLSEFAIDFALTVSATYNLNFNASTAYLDSPATTSAVTYKTQFRNKVAAAAVYVQNNGDMSTITLLEIAA
jgi:hypothetical protein